MLVLKNISEFTKNAISKSSIVSKVFSKKVFELSPYYWVLGFKVTFMLMPFLNYYFAKKQGGKKDLIEPDGLSGFEMFFTVLVEIIAI